MREIDLDFNAMDMGRIDVNLKTLYYFIVVAETGSITKAAQELYVTQSMLSKNIILLEQQLDARLLERDSRKLSLTRAGQFVYTKWKSLIKAYCNQLDAISRMAEDTPEVIRIGCFPALDAVAFLRPYTDRLQSQFQSLFIEVLRMNNTRLFEHLNSEKADLLFTLEKDIPQKSGMYMHRRVARLTTVAILRTDHPLACRKLLCFSDLRGQHLLFADPGGALSRRDWFPAFCMRHEIDPNDVRMVNNDLTAVLNAIGGHGVALGPACAFGALPDTVCAIEIADAPLDVAAVWRADAQDNTKSLIYSILE